MSSIGLARSFGHRAPRMVGDASSLPPASPAADPADPVATHASSPEGSSWLAPVLVVGIFGIVGYAMWSNYRIASSIAEKEGSTGLLKYEAGSAAIGVASGFASDYLHHDHDD